MQNLLQNNKYIKSIHFRWKKLHCKMFKSIIFYWKIGYISKIQTGGNSSTCVGDIRLHCLFLTSLKGKLSLAWQICMTTKKVV